MSKSRKVSSVRMRAKEVYAVNLRLKTGIGSRKVPLDWLGVDIAKTNPTLSEKLDAHVDNLRVSIIPAEMRKQFSNFRQNVRNSLVLKFVPMGIAGRSMSLMTKTMYDKAKTEFDVFSDEFDSLVEIIDKNFDTYEKDFYSLFEEALKTNPEKDAILRELKLMIPSKIDYLDSLTFEFESMPLGINKDLESRFIGKALNIAYKRAYLIERLVFKNDKVDMRSLSGIERDMDMFEDLEVTNIPEVKEVIKDLNDLLELNGHGKSTKKKAKQIMTKAEKYAIKVGAFDLVRA